MIDPEYLSKIIKFVNGRDNVQYIIADLSNDPPKMIEHLKYYADNRMPGMAEVEFKNLRPGETEFTEFRVLEYFDCIIKNQIKE